MNMYIPKFIYKQTVLLDLRIYIQGLICEIIIEIYSFYELQCRFVNDSFAITSPYVHQVLLSLCTVHSLFFLPSVNPETQCDLVQILVQKIMMFVILLTVH